MNEETIFTCMVRYTPKDSYGKFYQRPPKMQGYTFIGFQIPKLGEPCLCPTETGGVYITRCPSANEKIPLFVYAKAPVPLCDQYRIAPGDNPRTPVNGDIICNGSLFTPANAWDTDKERIIFEKIQ